MFVENQAVQAENHGQEVKPVRHRKRLRQGGDYVADGIYGREFSLTAHTAGKEPQEPSHQWGTKLRAIILNDPATSFAMSVVLHGMNALSLRVLISPNHLMMAWRI